MSGPRPVATRGRRIVFVIGSARPGGAEGQMVRLAAGLKARGEDVRVFFMVAGGALTRELDQAAIQWEVMRLHHWPPSSTGRNLFAFVRLAWRLCRSRPTTVIAWLPGAVWPALLAAQFLTRAHRVAGFRGEVFDRDLRWQAAPFRWTVSRAHAITINSPTLRHEAERWGAPSGRIHLIPNGVVVPDRIASAGAAPPVAVVVANYRWYKGHDVLMRALAATNERFTVRLCGEGDGKQAVHALASEFGLRSRVVFVDAPANVGVELAAAQFAIHPSLTEGMSNAILEELSYGLPVVATDVGATNLLVEDGVSGCLVTPGDSVSLARAIDALAGDAELRKSLSKGARQRAESFSWSRCVDSHLGLIEARDGRNK